MNAVETLQLFRIYGDGRAVALQGLTMNIEVGEVVVVFGPSGSGKSTLLRVLAGLDTPSAGHVTVFGDDLRELRGRGLREYRSRVLGYIDQHYASALAPELRARDFVALQPALLGTARAERHARADELLERVGLADRRDAYPAELSGGEQQRVALAAALAHGPRLLIADEPTGELDAANATTAYALIGELAREQRATTIVVSHDPQAATIADRVLHIRDGRVSAESAVERGHAEEIVLARGGWLRLPEDLLRLGGVADRARARVEDGGIVISPVAAAAVATEPERRPIARPGGVVAEVRGLTKAYGPRRVLDDVQASFRGGCLTAVTGPSGSGKTTLLHVLAGLVSPDRGEATVLGRIPDDELRRSEIALVAQDAHLIPFLSARENVALVLELRRAGHAPGTVPGTWPGEALDAVGLGELADELVSRLSTGERQRVALARAIASRPKLLLADEPTARLDEANARTIGSLFAQLAADTGAAVVCATHDPALIDQADARLELAPLGAG
ncbi:MAG TPA: ATP-binding cassette domain-containing protein [Gaiellaceae bacterium]